MARRPISTVTFLAGAELVARPVVIARASTLAGRIPIAPPAFAVFWLEPLRRGRPPSAVFGRKPLRRRRRRVWRRAGRPEPIAIGLFPCELLAPPVEVLCLLRVLVLLARVTMLAAGAPFTVSRRSARHVAVPSAIGRGGRVRVDSVVSRPLATRGA
jgi:hypothetical protein